MEAAEVYVTRRTDGKTALVEVPDTGEDLWTCIDRAFPRAWGLLDEDMVLLDGADHDWVVRFRPGEDPELAKWLHECEARAVELDEGGRVVKVLGSFEGGEYYAVSHARALAQEHLENSGKDTALMDVRVMMGGETVWSSQEAEVEAGFERDLDDDEGRFVSIRVEPRGALAFVTWTSEDGSEASQTIALNPGDALLILKGADPVAEGWEDGAGRPVCYRQAVEDQEGQRCGRSLCRTTPRPSASATPGSPEAPGSPSAHGSRPCARSPCRPLRTAPPMCI